MSQRAFPTTGEEVVDAMKAFIQASGKRCLEPNVLFMPYAMELTVRRWSFDHAGGNLADYLDPERRLNTVFGMRVVRAGRFLLAHEPRHSEAGRAEAAYALREYYGVDNADPEVVFWPG